MISDKDIPKDFLSPRRRIDKNIKLLRLELVARGKTPSEVIGCDWSLAQPQENLSPAAAARTLNIDVWSLRDEVQRRYLKLKNRYPMEQFMNKHVVLRPAAELLENPRLRLNWYWQSGLIPNFYGKCSEPPITPEAVVAQLPICDF